MSIKSYDYLIDLFETPEDFEEPCEESIQFYQYPNLNCSDFELNVKHETPADLLRFYTSVDVNDDGMFILASNNYTGDVFDAVFAGTRNFDDLVGSRFDQLEVNETFQTEIVDMKFLSNTDLYIATSTTFTIHSPRLTTTDELKLFKQAEAHVSGTIRCIGKNYGSAQIIIGTSSGDLEVLSYNNSLERSFLITRAHTEEVTGISSHPSKEKCWVTSSSDHTCVLWDKNVQPPASFLLRGHKCRLTDVKWLSENLILASDSSGRLITIDPRNPNVVISNEKVSNRIIHSLTFAESLKTFGIISESPELPIYQIKDDGQFELIHSHSARPHMLYSMAFDRKDENVFYVVGDKKYAKKITIEV